jgi:hypothetical protein
LEEEEASGFASDSATRLGYHWREAGQPERAIDYLLAAAKQAGRGWAKEEAFALYSQALELLPNDDDRRRGAEMERTIAYVASVHLHWGDVKRPPHASESPPTPSA